MKPCRQAEEEAGRDRAWIAVGRLGGAGGEGEGGELRGSASGRQRRQTGPAAPAGCPPWTKHRCRGRHECCRKSRPPAPCQKSLPPSTLRPLRAISRRGRDRAARTSTGRRRRRSTASRRRGSRRRPRPGRSCSPEWRWCSRLTCPGACPASAWAGRSGPGADEAGRGGRAAAAERLPGASGSNPPLLTRRPIWLSTPVAEIQSKKTPANKASQRCHLRIASRSRCECSQYQADALGLARGHCGNGRYSSRPRPWMARMAPMKIRITAPWLP